MTSDDAEDEISINEEENCSDFEEEMDEGKNVTTDCTSREFHVYRTVWKPKLTDKLMVLFEKKKQCFQTICMWYLFKK